MEGMRPIQVLLLLFRADFLRFASKIVEHSRYLLAMSSLLYEPRQCARAKSVTSRANQPL